MLFQYLFFLSKDELYFNQNLGLCIHHFFLLQICIIFITLKVKKNWNDLSSVLVFFITSQKTAIPTGGFWLFITNVHKRYLLYSLPNGQAVLCFLKWKCIPIALFLLTVYFYRLMLPSAWACMQPAVKNPIEKNQNNAYFTSCKRINFTTTAYRNKPSLLHHHHWVRLQRHISLSARGRGALTTTHADGVQMDRFSVSDFSLFLLPPCSPLFELSQAPSFAQWAAMINCAENFSEGFKWSSVEPVYLLNFLTWLCTERQMTALYRNCLKQSDCEYCRFLILHSCVVKYTKTRSFIVLCMSFLVNCIIPFS